jgi:Holliday junction resolvase RusA-like endonuclease
MPSIDFFVPGRPQVKQSVNKGRHSFYTDPKSKEYERLVKLVAFEEMKKLQLPPAEGPVHLEMVIHKLVPTSFSKKKYQMAIEGTLEPIKRPDVTNFIKVIEDGMNKVVFHDDSQVTKQINSKKYSEKEGIEVKVRWIF